MQKVYSSDSTHWQIEEVSEQGSDLKMMVNAFAMSRLDYCNSLYCGLPKREIDKLQRVQNFAARLILRIGRSDHTTPLTKDLHWLAISAHIEFKILLSTFKILKELAPYYLCSLFFKYQQARLLPRLIDCFYMFLLLLP